MVAGRATVLRARRAAAVAVAASAAATTLVAGGAEAAPGWRVTRNVEMRIGGGTANFDGATAVSPVLAWSVLGHAMGAGGMILLRWDGAGWRRVALPRSLADSSLSDIDATSRTNLWLAGQNAQMTRSFLARWDGKDWKTRLIPAGDSVERLLVRGAGDVWYFTLKGTAGHYDGEKWHTYRLGFTAFSAAVAGGKVWVVGGDTDAGTPRASVWNGRKWKATHVPGSEGTMYGVAASGGRVWTAGMVGGYPALLRWNGKAWKKAASPSIAVRELAPDGSGGLWASSWPAYPARDSGLYRFVKGHWSRAVVKGLPKSGHPLAVNSLVRIPGTRSSLWAVGGHDNGKTDDDALIMKYGS